MWVEAGFPPDTFWKQTQRSFSNSLTGVAKHRITSAWHIGVMSGLAYAGKLRALEDYLPGPANEGTKGAAQALGFLFKLKRKGIPMTIEKIERLH